LRWQCESPWEMRRLPTLETRLELPKEQSPGKPVTRRYSPEEKAAAVRMVSALRAELGTEHGTVQRVARQLGYGIESVRSWMRQADIDDGMRPG
jgi:transposase